MLTRDASREPLAPLRLDDHTQRLRLDADDGGAALEQAVVDEGAADQGEVARAERGRAVQPQHVPRHHVRHQERQPDRVPLHHEVGFPVDVHGDVVVWLCAQKGEELGDG